MKRLLVALALGTGLVLGFLAPQPADAGVICCVTCGKTHGCGLCVWLECGSCGPVGGCGAP